jgi:branched-chain amino acid transport system ATP-binding protein
MSTSGEAVLDVQKVAACYSTYKALFGVSLSVPERGLVALLGSNGAGKSTLARVISGLVRASEGSVCFAGTDITRMAPHKITRLGLVQVPEGRGIFSSLSVEENLQVAFRHSLARKDAREAMQRAFDAFPILLKRRSQRAGTLSGGEQRILSLAKVLSASPRLLVVDELSLGLAPTVVDMVYDGLVRIREGGTALLVVEQQIDRALSIADSAVLLAHGSVAWSGPASQATAAMERLFSGATDGAKDQERQERQERPVEWATPTSPGGASVPTPSRPPGPSAGPTVANPTTRGAGPASGDEMTRSVLPDRPVGPSDGAQDPCSSNGPVASDRVGSAPRALPSTPSTGKGQVALSSGWLTSDEDRKDTVI